MSEVDKHLSRPSLYGYRLAIGYFRVVKGGGESYPWFVSEFGGHGLSLSFGFLYQKSSLVPLAGRSVDSSLESPWSYADARLYKKIKLDLVLGNSKFRFGVLCSGIPGVCLASDFPIYRCIDWGREDAERLSVSSILVCFVCSCVESGNKFRFFNGC